MEACWLAATITVPLLYDPHAASGFNMPKAVLLRLFAILASGAWAVRSIAGRTVPAGATRNRAVVLAGAMFLMANLVSTAFSVFPAQSFWGFDFWQGTSTLLCYGAFFAAVAVTLRRRDQVERLVAAIILPTIPVSIYALVQWGGADPLKVFDVTDGRVSSLAGNPNYLSGYLALVLPITVWRVADVATARDARRGLRLAGILLYGSAGFLQVAGMLLAQSRGPLLGLAAGLAFLGVCWAAASGRRLLIAAALAATVAAGWVLGLQGAAGRPIADSRWPILRRLAGSLPARGGE